MTQKYSLMTFKIFDLICILRNVVIRLRYSFYNAFFCMCSVDVLNR